MYGSGIAEQLTVKWTEDLAREIRDYGNKQRNSKLPDGQLFGCGDIGKKKILKTFTAANN